ncbi:MAG: DUF1330 domain-containing protein [Thermoanaerobaculia bacterium]|nr:DUF1330 domain-containing protein [Thermoanaerobaculia bacterium]
MASYLIANYDVTNQEGYEQYLASVVPTIQSHEGKILVAGPGSTPVEGSPRAMTVVLEFPTREALEGWYNSAEYQEIIHHRTDNTDGTVVFADRFQMPG